MKRINRWVMLIVIILTPVALANGCALRAGNNDFVEVPMKDYYSKEDFESIAIGESTYKDVYLIAPAESMQITSYGGFCEYATQDGGRIRIKFYGKELIVGEIDDVPPFIESAKK